MREKLAEHPSSFGIAKHKKVGKARSATVLPNRRQVLDP